MPKFMQFHFTDKALKELPPQPKEARAREAEHSDTEVRGLKCLVGKNGSKVFYLRTRVGKRQRVTIRLGEFGPLSVKMARTKANQIKSHIALHGELPKTKEAAPKVLSFRAFTEKEYAPYAKGSKRSWKTEESMLNRYFLPLFGKRPLDSIGKREIQKYHTETKERLSPSTANRHLAFVHRIFQLAIEWGFISTPNPADGIKAFPEPKHRERYLSEEEIARLFTALEKDANKVAASAIRFLLLTGLRKGEALRAKWEHFDRERGQLFLPQTKNGKSRYLPLNEMAIDLLSKQAKTEGNPYIFPGRKEGSHIQTIDRNFYRARKAAKIEDVRIHDLRHSHASILINSNVDLYTIQTLLGHSNIRMTQRYSHLSSKSLKRAVSNVSDFVGRVGQPT